MTDESPYANVPDELLILRDQLAIDRTRLSNERTLLAYLRTAMALLVVGISFLEFADSQWIHIVAWISIGLSVGVALLGGLRYRTFQRHIERRKG